MTCHCFLRPFRRDLTSSCYTTLKRANISRLTYPRSNKVNSPGALLTNVLYRETPPLFRCIGNMRNLLDLKKLGAQGGPGKFFSVRARRSWEILETHR